MNALTPFDERGEDPLAVGVIAGPLRVVERAAILQQPRRAIARHSAPARAISAIRPSRRAPPHLHLPQPVLRHDVALREEQVVDGLRVDVRHAPLVTYDFNVLVQPGNRSSPSILARDFLASSFRAGFCALRPCQPINTTVASTATDTRRISRLTIGCSSAGHVFVVMSLNAQCPVEGNLVSMISASGQPAGSLVVP